jgi:hypothetical protein
MGIHCYSARTSNQCFTNAQDKEQKVNKELSAEAEDDG